METKTKSQGVKGKEHGVRDPCDVVCDRTGLFEKIFLPPKWGKWAKNSCLNLLENLVANFFWVWSIMKVYIIFCIAP